MKKNILLSLLICLNFCLTTCQHKIHSSNANNQQTIPQQSEVQLEQKKELKIASKSPYEIQRYLKGNPSASLKEVWQLLGMQENTALSYECKDDCYTRIKQLRLKNENLVLLNVGLPSGAYYEYLVFEKGKTNQKGKANWVFWGSVQSGAQQYGAPEYRIIRNRDKAWFVLEELWGRGSDFVLYGERWYELKEGMKEVLSYPKNGHLARYDLEFGRDFKLSSSNGVAMPSEHEIVIKFLITYTMGGYPTRKLFTKPQQVSYSWDSQAGKYVFNKAKSGISDEELEDVYMPEGLPLGEILQYNFPEFKAIASKGNRKEKEWLTKLMEAIEDSPEKRELQTMLKQHK